MRIRIPSGWATKDTKPYLSKDIRSQVFMHIKDNALVKGIYPGPINGYVEHVYCLDSLNSDHTLATIARLLKGGSSFWITKNKLTYENSACRKNILFFLFCALGHTPSGKPVFYKFSPILVLCQ